MTSLDELDTAIQTLTKLRDKGTPGPWHVSATGNELRAPSPFNGFALVTWANPDHDAELIVTLQALIDPVLAILRNFREVYGEENTPRGYQHAILALARSINGGTQ